MQSFQVYPMLQVETGNSQVSSQVETAKTATVSCRIIGEWDEKLEETANQLGKKKADVLRDAIGQYLGKEMPTVLNEIVETKLMLADVQEKNERLLKQNLVLHKRLLWVEAKFKN